jgi:uncharacterized surface protein with fasciclin (FAS1) repeats
LLFDYLFGWFVFVTNKIILLIHISIQYHPPRVLFINIITVDVICSPANTNVFGLFCDALLLFPDIVALLQDGCPFFDDDDVDDDEVTILFPGFRALSETDGNDATDAATVDIKEKQNEQGTRDLRFRFNHSTVFAPNNGAFRKLLSDQLDTLFVAPQTDVVIAYFDSEKGNIYGRLNDYTIQSFFFDDRFGKFLLKKIILTHILDRKLRFGQLDCRTAYNMLSGADTITECGSIQQNGIITKFQIGGGNLQSLRMPQIVQANIEASNGIIHEVNNIILPHFDQYIIDTPSPTAAPSFSPSHSPTEAPRCTKTIQFVYNTYNCNQQDKKNENAPGYCEDKNGGVVDLPEVMYYEVYDCNNLGKLVTSDNVKASNGVVLIEETLSHVECLPECTQFRISDNTDPDKVVIQIVNVDTSCDSNKNPVGAIRLTNVDCRQA